MTHHPLCTALWLYSLTAVVTTRQWRRHPSSLGKLQLGATNKLRRLSVNFADVICIFASCATLLVQEIIAILHAADTSADLLENRRIVLYSDSQSAEHTTAKGSARAADHNRMVHEIWTLALVKKNQVVD